MMKVLLDISLIGITTVHPERRAGGFRVDANLLDELERSGACELAFCATHSSIAYAGAREYLRSHPHLSRYSLTGQRESFLRSLALRGLTATYRRFRAFNPHGSLPGVVRSAGKLVDHGLLPSSELAADVFHSTHFPLPRRKQRHSLQRFITIYDLRHRAFPHLYDSRTIEVSEQILHSVESDDWVITTSAASRDELAATGAVRPQQIFVVPLAADPQQFRPCRDDEELQRVRTRYGIGNAPYILSVSSVDVRKNTHGAIEAFARLASEQRLGDLKFVIAGSSGSGSPLMQQALSKVRNIGERIIHTGFVEDRDLSPLYSGATFFLYPSLYEGFGLPPLEAMQCGTPVLTSNSSSLPEVVGDAGIMVSPGDLDALCSAMLNLLNDDLLRDQLTRKSLLRASQFSWAKTAQTVLAAYRSTLPRP